MVNHQEIAKEACEEMSKINGVSKILLFGSVARHEERPDSDVDLAVIVEEEKSERLSLELKCMPTEVYKELSRIKADFENKYGIQVNASPYMKSEYLNGIKLRGKKNRRSERLDKVGIVMYERSTA